ncbi:hypothetical protein [Mesorhizobium sp. ISC11]|uniref:hypothetical protein n=1 Tax=Mesorhizobium sp. ISC11 TaxID=3076428 RepID=UPI00301CBB1A
MTALMTFAAYADAIGVHASTVSRGVQKGTIPVVELADGRRLIDRTAADSARRRNSNIVTGHGGRPDRTLRKASEWKARQSNGYDPAVMACLCVMRTAWPDLVRKAMALLGADELNQARAVITVRDLVDTLAVAVHHDFNAGRVFDFREPLTPIPELTWASPEVQAFFEAVGGTAETEFETLWTSDEPGEGLPGGETWAWEASLAHDRVSAR